MQGLPLEFPNRKKGDGALRAGQLPGGDLPQEGEGEGVWGWKEKDRREGGGAASPIPGQERPGPEGWLGDPIQGRGDGKAGVSEAVQGPLGPAGKEKGNQPHLALFQAQGGAIRGKADAPFSRGGLPQKQGGAISSGPPGDTEDAPAPPGASREDEIQQMVGASGAVDHCRRGSRRSGQGSPDGNGVTSGGSGRTSGAWGASFPFGALFAPGAGGTGRAGFPLFAPGAGGASGAGDSREGLGGYFA